MQAAPQHSPDDLLWPAVAVTGPTGPARFVLVCEHASAFIPPSLGDLGMDDAARRSHAAWDIGAVLLARRLSARLGAPLVEATMSRLVYDCNRPLDAADAIPARSEIHDVPGNAHLSPADQEDRFAHVHEPFHNRLADVLTKAGPEAALVTVHSFTPIFKGEHRTVEIGYLFDTDPALANAAHRAETAVGRYLTAINQPYGPDDGVTHTLKLQGEATGRASVMVEVRNDLIGTAAEASAMADHLATILTTAHAALCS